LYLFCHSKMIIGAVEKNYEGGMFSKLRNESDGASASAIRRKTFEQIEMERMAETIEELKATLENQEQRIMSVIREELRSFHSKFETWQDIKRLQGDLERRERDISAREEALKQIRVDENQ
jgi:TolA-binding protein